jgi:hypothetical protein
MRCDNPVFDVGPSGSSLFFRYRGHNFGVCTRHQFGTDIVATKPEEFVLIIDGQDGRKVGVTPNNVTRVTFEHEGHQNLSDIFIAGFDDMRGDRDLRAHFLQIDLSKTLSSVPAEQVRAIFAIGFPTSERDADLTYDEEDILTGIYMKVRWIKLYLELADTELLDTQNRRPLIKHRTFEQELRNPDGLSGAPVFFIFLDASLQAHLGFAGMITHSNGTRFMIYEAETIRLLLDRYIDENKSCISAVRS